jgi:hypothetical protein
MKHALKFTLVLAAAITAPAFAGDLVAPPALDTAQVLPAGVRNPRFLDVFVTIDSKFGGGGALEPLGQPLDKPITWADVLKTQPDGARRQEILGMRKDAGLDGTTSPGSTSGAVNSYVNVKVPVLAWGITDRLTIAAVMPIVHIDVTADTGFVQNATGQAFVQHAAEHSPQQGDEAARKLNNAVSDRLQQLGYLPIGTTSIDHLGDSQLVAKYNTWNDGVNSLSLKGVLTVPTGQAPNVNAALDIPTGDGQFDLGAGVVYDRMITEDLRWNTNVSYTNELSDSLQRRIPMTSDDPLSADIENVSRTRGDLYSIGTSMNYSFPSIGVNTGAGYMYQYQGRTHFTGSEFDPIRYTWLSQQTPLEDMHSLTLAAGFSTVDWFKMKKFVYPFQVNFTYTHPLAGRNVESDDLVMGELVMFF